MLVQRPQLVAQVQQALAESPVVLILGPRQCGKTTLAGMVAEGQDATCFDLEDPESALQPEIAKQVLGGLTGLVVIDECQRQPDLFPLLRVLADRDPPRARFLILGSASPDLVRGVSETLAGRVTYIEMSGLDVVEVGADRADDLWVRGGFPRSFLADDDAASTRWRRNFIQSFLERDLPQLGIRVPTATLRRFWMMIAHLHGNLWNASELARSLGVKGDTARHYLDILTGAFMLRQLPPWYENVGKRLVKSPKVYLRDSGIFHALLALGDKLQVQSHPKLAASWEGFALEQVVRLADADRDAFFYRTHAGAELDLLLQRKGKRYGFEFKYADAPKMTRSMHQVITDLGLDRLWVVYPGERRWPLQEGVEVLPLSHCPEVVAENGLSPL